MPGNTEKAIINIRQANQTDLKAIKKIADLLYLDIPDFVWNKDDFIEGQIKKGEYYVAEDYGKIIGIMSLRERNQMLYIETLVVAKDIQTKGVGTKLVDFAKQLARGNGFKVMRTTSFFEYNVKDFWIKQDFKLLDEPGEYEGHKFYRFEATL